VRNTYVYHGVVSKERLEERPEHQETQEKLYLVMVFVVFFELLVVGSQVVTHPTRFPSKQLANKHMSVSLQLVVEQFVAALTTVQSSGRHYWNS